MHHYYHLTVSSFAFTGTSEFMPHTCICMMLISDPTSPERTVFSVPCKAGLVVTRPRLRALKKFFTSLVFLKDSFARYRILG